MPVKYTDELRACAVDLVLTTQSDPYTSHGAIQGTSVSTTGGISASVINVTYQRGSLPLPRT